MKKLKCESCPHFKAKIMFISVDLYCKKFNIHFDNGYQMKACSEANCSK